VFPDNNLSVRPGGLRGGKQRPQADGRILIPKKRLAVPLDKNEGVVKIDFFAVMLCSTVWISERWRTEALKLSR
jgi:hypothetical protein